jgi:hypothetical protein
MSNSSMLDAGDYLADRWRSIQWNKTQINVQIQASPQPYS